MILRPICMKSTPFKKPQSIILSKLKMSLEFYLQNQDKFWKHKDNLL